MEYKTSMTEGSIWKKMLLFCIPLILGNLFQQLYSTIDSVIVGKLIGKTALAAVGACEPIISFIIGLCAGASAGAGVVISQLYGAKKEADLKRAVHTAIAIGLILGAALEIITIAITPAVLNWIKTPNDVIDQAVLYLQVYFGGMIFTVVFNMGAGILNAVGNSKRSLLYLSIASAINIALDLVFVVVFNWGIFGAAFATMLSQMFTCICIIAFLRRCKDPLYRLELKSIKVDREHSIKILRIGIPTSIQNMVRCFANILVQAGINSFGSMAMAGYAAYLRVDGILWLPLMSLGMAASTFTGQNIGAGQYERAKKGAIISAGASGVFTAIMSAVLILFRAPIISIFNSDPEVIEYGVITMMGYLPLYWVFAVYNALAGAITGAGKTFEAMIISIASLCIFRIIMLEIVTKASDSFQVLLSIFPASWIAALIAIAVYMWRSDWLGLEKKENLKPQSQV